MEMDRRTFVKFLPFIPTALAACVRPEARSVQSAQPGRTPAADMAKPRESQKTPTPQKEVSVTVEQKAIQIALTEWTSLFDRDQPPNQYGVSFSPRIQNQAVWTGNIAGVVSKNVHSTEVPMQVRWEATGGAWKKFVGEMQINNVKISGISTRPISDADRANGLSWQGSVTISFISRYHANAFVAGRDRGTPQEIQTWLSFSNATPLPPFSQWEGEAMTFNMSLRNGQWGRDRISKYTSDFIIGDTEMPSDAFIDAMTKCIRRGQPQCQEINFQKSSATK